VRFLKTLVLTLVLCGMAHGGELRDGILHVDGKPFFPMGSWSTRSPEQAVKFGLNTAFFGAPKTARSAVGNRKRIQDYAAHGIQCVLYLSYGGEMVNPWTEDQINAAASLGTEPNVLAWYTGDDIVEKHLEGMEWRVTKLRKVSPRIPTVADYIAKPGKDAQRTFTKFIDIRCQYTYPVGRHTMPEYVRWFDMQRKFVGDPLWTWIQAFSWTSEQRKLNLGVQGYGPVPTPEQVYVMCYIGLNRGLRGLFIYPHRGLPRLPGVAAVVSRAFRETNLFNEHLAAGSHTFDLAVSDTTLKATAVNYQGSTVVPAVVVKDFYSDWIDNAVMTNQWIDVPWTGNTPRAVLVETPDLVECPVTVKAGIARISIPRIELAGFIYITSDNDKIADLRKKVAAIPYDMRSLIVPAASVQGRVTKNVMWRSGWDALSNKMKTLLVLSSQIDECATLSSDGDATGAFRAWKVSQHTSRTMIDSIMQGTRKAREFVRGREAAYFDSPFGLHNLGRLDKLPKDGDPRRFVRNWEVVGPFPLEWDGKIEGMNPFVPGFDKVYGPEKPGVTGPYETVDGATNWQTTRTDLSGMLDFKHEFVTGDNVLAYARVIVHAREKTKTTMRIGHNDGAKVLVNGKQVYVLNRGGLAKAHEFDFPVLLEKGDNVVLVKLANMGGRWQLFLSVDDLNHKLKFGMK
jgi:hypothetical protein